MGYVTISDTQDAEPPNMKGSYVFKLIVSFWLKLNVLSLKINKKF